MEKAFAYFWVGGKGLVKGDRFIPAQSRISGVYSSAVLAKPTSLLSRSVIGEAGLKKRYNRLLTSTITRAKRHQEIVVDGTTGR
jgi:hypothetical protein